MNKGIVNASTDKEKAGVIKSPSSPSVDHSSSSADNSNNENKSGKDGKRNYEGWQILTYKGKNAMKKQKFSKAIACFNQAMNHTAGIPLMLLVSECHLGNGNATEALRYAYTACETEFGNPIALITKAKCHLALNDIEAAYLSCYSAYNSHQLLMLNAKDAHTFENTHIVPLLPLLNKLTQSIVGHIRSNHKNLTQSSFPLSTKIATVPFTIECANNGAKMRINIMQDFTGKGELHLCQPKNKTEPESTVSTFPNIQSHTSCTDGTRIIVFGGWDAAIEAPCNIVRIFEFNEHISNRYLYKVQPCSGDIPPPNQGHSCCIVGRQMFMFGGDSEEECNDLYTLDLDHWRWSKLSSLSNTTENQDRPEIDVLYSTLVQFDSESIIVIGGMKCGSMSNFSGDPNGFKASDDSFTNIVSTNMHVYSLKNKSWERLNNCGSLPPKGWGFHAHNIATGKVLLYCGQYFFGIHTKKSPYLLTTIREGSSDTGDYKWSRIEENMNGIPPPKSLYMGTTWIPHTKCLIMYGGRHTHHEVSDSVFEMENSDDQLFGRTMYDTELYSFDITSKQWTRLRVPGDAKKPRSCHTLNTLRGKLIALGGSTIQSGIRGFENTNKRDYATEVLCYDLNLPKIPSTQTKQMNSTKHQQVRIGHLKRKESAKEKRKDERKNKYMLGG